MPKSIPETDESVAERLLGGVLALVGEGETRPSLRRIVERSGRSTMCVYTYFGGRSRLMEEAHRRAGAGLLDAIARASDIEARAVAAHRWFLDNASTADWLFSRDAPDAEREQLIRQCSNALDDPDTERLAILLGRLVLRR